VKERSWIRDFDWWLLGLALAIAALGILEIYSATHNGNLAGLHWKQLSWVGVGVLCLLALAFVNYHSILDQAPVLYLLGLASLVAVLFFGHTRFGSKSWLVIGGVNLQVSEFMKLAIIVALARFFGEVRTDRLLLPDLVRVAVLTGVPVGLVLLQPDFGTAMMMIPAALMGVYLTGLQWKHALALVLLAVVLLPVGWSLLKPYQKERIFTFLRPDEHPQSAGYQTLQSKIAVGSGGFWGKGFGKGSQNQLGFVPVRWSDFIFAALAEEMGFSGVLLTLLLYMALLLRLVQHAQRAGDRAGMFIVMGVTAILGFHILINVAMVIGYMPVTGIPLPLMSYGGSATLFVFMALGLVMSVRMRRFVN